MLLNVGTTDMRQMKIARELMSIAGEDKVIFKGDKKTRRIRTEHFSGVDGHTLSRELEYEALIFGEIGWDVKLISVDGDGLPFAITRNQMKHNGLQVNIHLRDDDIRTIKIGKLAGWETCFLERGDDVRNRSRVEGVFLAFGRHGGEKIFSRLGTKIG